MPDSNITNFYLAEFLIYQKDGLYVVLFLSVLMVLGIVGNVQVIVIYLRNYHRSNVKIFITALASSDLSMCVLAIPVFIFDVRRNLAYVGEGICQLSRLLTVSLSLSSLLLQTMIAVERYKKVCKPLDPQWTPRQVTIGTVLIFGISALASTPTLAIFGKVTKNVTEFPGINGTGIQNLHGYTCGAKLRFANFIHATAILPIITICLIIVVILYSLVFRTIVKRKALSRVFEIRKYEERRTSVVSYISEETVSNDDQWSADRLDDRPADNIAKVKLKMRDRKMEKACRISVMFMFVFILSYIGIVPIIALNIVRAVDAERFRYLHRVLGQFMEILLFGGLLNNVVNPLVYICIDEKFRFYWKRLFTFMCPFKKASVTLK